MKTARELIAELQALEDLDLPLVYWDGECEGILPYTGRPYETESFDDVEGIKDGDPVIRMM